MLYRTQSVPIPCITYSCKHRCCERTSCPLTLSFARTIDTFQGQTAGPSVPGQPPNDVERIIIDPGGRRFEASGKTGLFYTMFGRGTTMGQLVCGKRIGSAFYFHDFGLGNHGTLRASRFAMLRGPPDKPEVIYKAIERRDTWMQHLCRNAHGSTMGDEQISNTLQWAAVTRITEEQMDGWIDKLTRGSDGDVP